jgi:hypothetical protein
MNAHLTIDGELWSEVEWSEKRQRWCIQDAQGRCLTHKDHIHAFEVDKAAAVALAKEMIRDGRLPSPEEAGQQRKERLQRDRERRAKQPSEIRRREKREEDYRLDREKWEAEKRDENETPLWEVLADAINLDDPELWKSNSFALLRPRLIITLRAAIADLDYNRRHGFYRWKSSEQEKRLVRARRILECLEAAE